VSRRIFWDTMLFIYLLEGNEKYSRRCWQLLAQARDRGDQLYTSHLALGELLAGSDRAREANAKAEIKSVLREAGFSYLPFQEEAVETFAQLRAIQKLRVADSIHLACAGAAGIDLFLTGDKQLLKVHVPGINFIADFDTPLF
jgi:uncharacterized protein